MKKKKIIILGSGAAGVSSAYHLKKQGLKEVIIYEKDEDWGGLCANFSLEGFRFDRFVHFSFPKDPYISNHFEEASALYQHLPISTNYFQGKWLKHPAQNNLAPLPIEIKTKIILDFINRPKRDVESIINYEEWLRCQYGDYFAENFPFAYTRKYWGVEAKELETKWVGERMYSPNLEEVLLGAFEEQEKNFYYTSFMKYPLKGGFRSILNKARDGLDIRFEKKVVQIDTNLKKVTFEDGSQDYYEVLISTLPLPEMAKILVEVPTQVTDAAADLMFTSGYQVSLGFNRADVCKNLWFYIYDEDIPPSRVYSPNLKSPDNAPVGCSSLQAEIFFNNRINIPSKQYVFDCTVNKLEKMGIFRKSEIIVKDIRFEKYANIIFDHNIYKNRMIIMNFLKENRIQSIGRFGRWDYLWSHQAFEDGIKVTEEFI